MAMHRLVGDFELERPHWSWRPQNSKCLMSNARLDKILAKAWPRRPLTAHGRILASADGWYECKPVGDGPKARKRPVKRAKFQLPAHKHRIEIDNRE